METQNLVEATAIPRPPATVMTDAESALEQARSLVVTTPDHYLFAVNFVKDVKRRWKAIDDARTTLKKPLDEGVARIQAFFKPALTALSDAEQVIKGKIATYDAEQERVRQENQRRLDEEARKERERIQKKADDEAAAARAKQDELDRQAREAQERGDSEAAARASAEAVRVAEKSQARQETLATRASQVVAPVAVSAAPKAAGISSRQDWDVEIVNPNAVPREYCDPSIERLKQFVKATNGQGRVPGVRIFAKTVTSVRR